MHNDLLTNESQRKASADEGERALTDDPVSRPGQHDLLIVVALLVIIAIAMVSAWWIGGAAPSTAFNARVQIVLVGVTAAAVVIALWYAYLTRRIAATAQRQAASAERQMQATEKQLKIADGQLALMKQEIADSRLARLQDQKPVVFIDRVEGDQYGEPRRHVYAMRNVGGGFALNVYYFDVTITKAVSLGALAAGGERTLPGDLNRALCDGGAGLHALLVAEAQFSRTTQWTTTLNLRTQTAGDHKGQVIHRTATVAVEPPRFQYQSLSDYMTANHRTFRQQLQALTEQDYLGPRLLEQRMGEAPARTDPAH